MEMYIPICLSVLGLGGIPSNGTLPVILVTAMHALFVSQLGGGGYEMCNYLMHTLGEYVDDIIIRSWGPRMLCILLSVLRFLATT